MSNDSAYQHNGPRPIPVGGCVIRETNTSMYPVTGYRIPDFEGQKGDTIAVQSSSGRVLIEDPDRLVYVPEWDDVSHADRFDQPVPVAR